MSFISREIGSQLFSLASDWQNRFIYRTTEIRIEWAQVYLNVMEMQQLCFVLNKYWNNFIALCWSVSILIICCCNFNIFSLLHTCEYRSQQQVWFNITSLFTAQPYDVLIKKSVSYWPCSIMPWATMNRHTWCRWFFYTTAAQYHFKGQELDVFCLLSAGLSLTNVNSSI